MKNGKEEIRSSYEYYQTRRYQKQKKASWAKLKIRNEDGWTSKMRTNYFKLNEKAYELLLKGDMTDPKNRPEGISKKDIKRPNNYAEGIWSDSSLDKKLERIDQFIRFTISKDAKKKKEGFFKDNPTVKEVKTLGQLNQHHLKEFVQHKLDTVAASSVRKYVGDLQKVFEITSKEVLSHKTLMKKCGKDSEIVSKIPHRTKDEAIRNVGKIDGRKGYSLEEARKIEKELRGDPLAHLACSVFLYTASRYDALDKMVWSDVVDEKAQIRDEMEWLTPGMLKGGRVQIAEVNQAKDTLEDFYVTGGFSPSDSIFGNVSRYKLEKSFKGACERAGVDWKAFHAYRDANVEYYETEKIPEMKVGLTEKQQKEAIAKEILKYVNIEVPDKDGNLHKPHNKMVDKMEYVKVPKKDANGNVMRKKNGDPIMVKDMRFGKNGNPYPRMVKVPEHDGHPVKEPKYTLEKLMREQLRTLEGMYVAQQISHNRSDANAPYRTYRGTASKTRIYNVKDIQALKIPISQ